MAASSGTVRTLLGPVLLALLGTAGISAAGPVLPEVVVDPAHTTHAAVLGAPPCTLEPGPMSAVSYAFLNPDAFSTIAYRIPECPACGPNSGVDLEWLNLRVRWFGACEVVARVTVVAASGTTCPAPDTTQVRFGPAIIPVSGTAAQGEIELLPFPPNWCASPGDFVVVRFIGFDNCGGTSSPGITRTTSACVPCNQYVTTTVSYPALTDWCSVGSLSLWTQLHTGCCANVGVESEPAAGRPLGISVLGAPGRPVRLALRLPDAGDAEVEVFDLAGRRVRALLRAPLGAGAHVVEWDGSTDTGARARAGVYRVRVRSGAGRATTTAILLD